MTAGDQLEIGTPHFSVRLLRAGDYRIDVDPARGTSRLTVCDGHAFVAARMAERSHTAKRRSASGGGV